MDPQSLDDQITGAFAAKDVAGIIGLLDKGLDPNWKNARGDTLLHAAAKLGDTGLIGKLVEKGAKAFAYNDDAETPWDVAVIWGNDRCAQILQKHIGDEKLTRGNDPIAYQSLQEIRDRTAATGVNQLHDLARRGQFNQVLALCAGDAQGLGAADYLSKGLDGDTVLLKICQQGQLPLLAKPELWIKKPQDFQALWDNVPAHYKNEVDYDSFVGQLRQMKLQSYGKPKLKGFQK